MDSALSRRTKDAAYCIWALTGHENTMDLWYLAEDMACYLVKINVLTIKTLNGITNLPKDDLGYITFVRNLAYRLYIYTKCDDAFENWINAEKLLAGYNFCGAMIDMADLIVEIIHSEDEKLNVTKRYYEKFWL